MGAQLVLFQERLASPVAPIFGMRFCLAMEGKVAFSEALKEAEGLTQACGLSFSFIGHLNIPTVE